VGSRLLFVVAVVSVAVAVAAVVVDVVVVDVVVVVVVVIVDVVVVVVVCGCGCGGCGGCGVCGCGFCRCCSALGAWNALFHVLGSTSPTYFSTSISPLCVHLHKGMQLRIGVSNANIKCGVFLQGPACTPCVRVHCSAFYPAAIVNSVEVWCGHSSRD
jgi:hypothetical protein